jgi:hypothetical protein
MLPVTIPSVTMTSTTVFGSSPSSPCHRRMLGAGQHPSPGLDPLGGIAQQQNFGWFCHGEPPDCCCVLKDAACSTYNAWYTPNLA